MGISDSKDEIELVVVNEWDLKIHMLRLMVV